VQNSFGTPLQKHLLKQQTQEFETHGESENGTSEGAHQGSEDLLLRPEPEHTCEEKDL